ncbi:MAG: hypothetical protein U0N91_05490 [Oscillospiraceae bacterium]
MQDDIKKVIEDIYINGDIELFTSKCRKKVDFLDELMEKLKNKSENIERFVDSNEPSSEIRITVNRCSFSEGEVEYVSLLQINKVIKYFYLQDEFSIDSPDPDGMDSYLTGFRNEPYSKKQFDIDEMICNYLTEKGYSRLYINDMDEVYPGIKKFKDREEINQMTVGNALFMDMWELCNND